MKNFLKKANASPFGNEKGGSMLATLMVVILIGLVAMAGLKVAPLYMDNSVVVNAINGMAEEEDLGSMNVRRIREGLAKTLLTNGIRDFDGDSVQKVNERGDEYLAVNYEARVPLFYNIEAVVVFTNRFEFEKE